MKMKEKYFLWKYRNNNSTRLLALMEEIFEILRIGQA